MIEPDELSDDLESRGKYWFNQLIKVNEENTKLSHKLYITERAIEHACSLSDDFRSEYFLNLFHKKKWDELAEHFSEWWEEMNSLTSGDYFK